MKKKASKKQRKPKTVPLGKLKPLTEEELDEMAIVTPEDIERAFAFADKYATKRGKELLNATKRDTDG